MNDVHRWHLFICWLGCRKVVVLHPGCSPTGLDFHRETGKLDRSLPAPLATLFLPLSRFCFMLAFGLLHALGSFDLGQKEI